jgi:HTH-type transcriptional regulator/antitoxin HipB
VQILLTGRWVGAEHRVDMHDRARTFLGGLAAAVRQRRRDLGLTQVELAELARCSTRFLHTVEAGKATVRLDKLLDLLGVLGLALQIEHPGVKGAARR